MTEEERIDKVEHQRKRCANMTEDERIMYEQQAYMNEKQKKRRMKNSEINRRRRANMSKEERMKRAENERIRRANMTEDERIKKREYERARNARLTEEGRVKKRNYERKRRGNMTVKERIDLLNYDRKRRADKVAQSTKDQLEEQFMKTAGYNPLQYLIQKMINSRMNVDIISGLSTHLFQGILELIGINHTYKRNECSYKSAIRNLACEIDVCYLIELLRRWKDWPIPDRFQYFPYDDLFCYIRSNVLSFQTQRGAFLLKELNNLFDTEFYISATCSFKQLQSLFHHSPQDHVNFYSDNVPFPRRLKESVPKYINILPYVSTRIALPNFSMSHQNNHFDEYKLFNMTSGLNVNKNKNLIIKQTSYIKYPERYFKRNVMKFLNQLRFAVMEELPGTVTIEKRAELLLALTIFENDIAQCPDIIVSNFNYDKSPAAYPYARYLGYTDDGEICISMSDQKTLNDSVLNVRLQQIRHPNVRFFLETFNVPYEVQNKEPHYTFDERFLYKINTCLTYDCLLCDEGLGSTSPSRLISDHFIKFHGLEPDWECTNCVKSFTNKYLLDNDWKHDCQ